METTTNERMPDMPPNTHAPDLPERFAAKGQVPIEDLVYTGERYPPLRIGLAFSDAPGSDWTVYCDKCHGTFRFTEEQLRNVPDIRCPNGCTPLDEENPNGPRRPLGPDTWLLGHVIGDFAITERAHGFSGRGTARQKCWIGTCFRCRRRKIFLQSDLIGSPEPVCGCLRADLEIPYAEVPTRELLENTVRKVDDLEQQLRFIRVDLNKLLPADD